MPGQLPIRLPLGLVNAYLLRGAGGDILIDTGMSGRAAGLLRLLAQHGSSADALKLIIITHVHFDHVGGLAALRARSRAPVLVHRAEASILRSGAVVLPAGQTPLARVLTPPGL